MPYPPDISMNRSHLGEPLARRPQTSLPRHKSAGRNVAANCPRRYLPTSACDQNRAGWVAHHRRSPNATYPSSLSDSPPSAAFRRWWGRWYPTHLDTPGVGLFIGNGLWNIRNTYRMTVQTRHQHGASGAQDAATGNWKTAYPRRPNGQCSAFEFHYHRRRDPQIQVICQQQHDVWGTSCCSICQCESRPEHNQAKGAEQCVTPCISVITHDLGLFNVVANRWPQF